MTTPSTIEELHAELERVRESVTSLQAQLDLSRQLHKEACGIANETKAELERVNRTCAEMRDLLEEHKNCTVKVAGCIPDGRGIHHPSYLDRGKSIREFLNRTDVGTGYFSREQVEPLVEALNSVVSWNPDTKLIHCLKCGAIVDRCNCLIGRALRHAAALGITKEDA